MVGHLSEGYLVEMIPMGNAIKVCAVDPVTGTEVICVGAPSATRKELTDLAIRKLEYVLAKNRSKT